MTENIEKINSHNLVVGAGLSGATAARLIAEELGEEVLVIDKKSHIAGNSYDYRDENGILIHKYGSHIFHTNNADVWNFVTRFASFSTYMHKVYALIDGIEANIPFNLDTIYKVFPVTLARKIECKLLKLYPYGTKVPILEFNKTNDGDLNFLADYVYKNVFLNYTLKQWGQSPDEIDFSVTARVPVYISRDPRYFYDTFQGIPYAGISGLVNNMLNHEKIKFMLNTDYSDIRHLSFKRIFYTGSIDEYFNYKFGPLPYRSVNFKFETFKKEYIQSNSVINYPNNYDFTRVHEFKHFSPIKSDYTVIAKEYSYDFMLNKNDRYYPIQNPENQELYNKYLFEAAKLKNVYFLGRLGDYKYYNMDKAIECSMNLIKSVIKNDIKVNI